MKRSFFGGVHPKYNKEMSSRSQEIASVVPSQVTVPLLQHVGAPCKPLVAVGDYVRKGQKIGDGDGMCVPVHASVSGTVSAIEERLHPNGQTVESIVIDSDSLDNCVEFSTCHVRTDLLDIDDVLHRIREAGIVGMGGAAFPGDIKALSALGNVDTVIANACECEPYITSDDTLLRTNAVQVFEGMMIINRVLAPSRLVLAIEDNKPEAIEAINELREKYPQIELAVLPTMYPQGSEKQLIQAVTGRQVPPAGRPTSVGCVVYNVSTYAAIYRAVRLGLPLIDRIVTVTGEGVRSPQNLYVRIGTPFSEVIDKAGGLKGNADRVISGGPMMGVAQSELSAPVVKATNSILCLPALEDGEREGTVCIRCGKCVDVCPMHLRPLYMYRYTLAEDTARLIKLNIGDCMECGCCAYTCPGRLPLVKTFRRGKILVKEEQGK